MSMSGPGPDLNNVSGFVQGMQQQSEQRRHDANGAILDGVAVAAGVMAWQYLNQQEKSRKAAQRQAFYEYLRTLPEDQAKALYLKDYAKRRNAFLWKVGGWMAAIGFVVYLWVSTYGWTSPFS